MSKVYIEILKINNYMRRHSSIPNHNISLLYTSYKKYTQKTIDFLNLQTGVSDTIPKNGKNNVG